MSTVWRGGSRPWWVGRGVVREVTVWKSCTVVSSKEKERKKPQLGGSDEEYAVRPYCTKKAGKLEGVVAENKNLCIAQ